MHEHTGFRIRICQLRVSIVSRTIACGRDTRLDRVHCLLYYYSSLRLRIKVTRDECSHGWRCVEYVTSFYCKATRGKKMGAGC
jgi:hypothetical protein